MNVKWEHLAAGVSGGVLSTLVLHPLDLIKIRFQVDEGVSTLKRPQYRGILHAITSIARQEGLGGLYKGVTPNVWGAGSSWGLYFLFYNSFKSHLLEKKQVQSLSATSHMIIACEAGSLTLLLTNPIWVAKTRLCLQYDALARPTLGSANPKFIHYRGLVDCVRQIYKHEGVKGLYRGLIPGLFGVSHGALQFMAYEELKKFYNKQRNYPADAKFSSMEYLTFAALSKIFAASTTYPYQVVRARLQDQHRNYGGVLDVIKKTYKLEGLRGFFKGLSPYLLHVTPNICIVFLVYEKVTSRN